MADSLVSAGPRTLHEAKQIIQSLRSQLGHGPLPGGKPIPGKVDTQPVASPRSPPIPNAVLDLGRMPPATFERFLSERTDPEIKWLLSRETSKGAKQQNAGVISKLYKEIKKRGA